MYRRRGHYAPDRLAGSLGNADRLPQKKCVEVVVRRWIRQPFKPQIALIVDPGNDESGLIQSRD